MAIQPRQSQFGPLMDSDRTLWMGDLEMNWDGNFVKQAFVTIGQEPLSVKMTSDKVTKLSLGYCFVEFQNYDTARLAMLNANGNDIPGSDPVRKFNLSYANDPRTPSVEYNLFVNNIDLEMTDADLFQVFGWKYHSCRGAKVYRHQDGTSRGLGFVRFGDQTDQQTALVEMNLTVVKGRTMQLKLAHARQRVPRSYIRDRDGQQQQQQQQQQQTYHPQQQGMSEVAYYPPVSISHAPAPMMMGDVTGNTATMLPTPVVPTTYAAIYYPTAEEANNMLIEEGDVWWEELEESRWSSCITDCEWNEHMLSRNIINSRW